MLWRFLAIFKDAVYKYHMCNNTDKIPSIKKFKKLFKLKYRMYILVVVV